MSGASTTAHDNPCHKFRVHSRCSKERRDNAGAVGAPNRHTEAKGAAYNIFEMLCGRQ
jgi:hypothetical protein